jgi:hypothetical protein
LLRVKSDKSRDVLRLEEELADALGTTVEIRVKKRSKRGEQAASWPSTSTRWTALRPAGQAPGRVSLRGGPPPAGSQLHYISFMNLLLAEDDALLADALAAQLRRAGFEVEHAPNGAVAEYLLSRQTYDAAILDIGLPMMDGLAVLEGLRQTRPTLPVMLLTARDGLEDRVPA